jgi:hypothetical protein
MESNVLRLSRDHDSLANSAALFDGNEIHFSSRKGEAVLLFYEHEEPISFSVGSLASARE